MIKQSRIIIFILLILVGAGIFLFFRNKTDAPKVCFKGHCFFVELAQSQSELERGLMSRESMPQDRGMLFIFQEEGIYPFWMKNTLIPLDMIWLDSNKEVVFISEDTQPCKVENCLIVNPGKEAKYVLEINGGLSKKLGLTEGAKLEF
jgi:uncharacterized protein